MHVNDTTTVEWTKKEQQQRIRKEKIDRKESLGTKKGKIGKRLSRKKKGNCVCENVICAKENREEKRKKSMIKMRVKL